MKKWTILIALVLALTLLAACGKQHEHEWVDATCTEPETCAVCGETRGEALGHRWKSGSCTEPQTCARCGETQGEPLGHDWQDATCTEPQVCARCGETQGEPLGHDWQDATCTEPQICARCGETQGEPLGHDATPADYWTASVCSRCGEELAPKLTPDFVAYGLDAHFVELDKTYDYRTICYENENYTTVGKATFSKYQVIESDGDKLEARDGYVWRTVHLEIVFDDENAWEYGMYPSFCMENYYDVREHDDSGVYHEETGRSTFTVTFRGKAYECQFFREGSYLGWSDHSNTYVTDFYVQLPADFDGYVVGARDNSIPWPDGAYAFDLDNSGTLYFRMN